MSVIEIFQQSFRQPEPFVDNWTVSKHRNKDHVEAAQAHPSWRGLRLANMPIRLWLVLLAALLGGFLAILLHK